MCDDAAAWWALEPSVVKCPYHPDSPARLPIPTDAIGDAGWIGWLEGCCSLPAWRCTLGDLHDYRHSGREPEANRFAAELLMPERFFKDDCDRDRPCLDDIIELADRYGTSLLSTAIRFTKFSPERCAAVVSRDGRVTRVSRSADWRYFIPDEHHLTNATYAGDLHAGRNIPSRPQRVEARAWSDATWIGDQDVFEHTMLLGGTGMVLTMLWEPFE